MATIILRQGVGGKGSPLTNAEVDANFTNLNTDKIETADAVSTNTANKVVKRDATGNFSAGTITATFTGNLTGNVTGNASTATSATTATNLAGGSAGTIPYQSAAGTTVQLSAGTSGQLLKSNGAAAPSWINTSSIDAGSVDGKSFGTFTAAGGILYATSTTEAAAIGAGTAGQVLISTGSSAPTWGNVVAGATGGGSDKIFWENDQTISVNYTLTAGKNAGTFGPVEVANGITVTIPDGSVWTIV